MSNQDVPGNVSCSSCPLFQSFLSGPASSTPPLCAPVLQPGPLPHLAFLALVLLAAVPFGAAQPMVGRVKANDQAQPLKQLCHWQSEGLPTTHPAPGKELVQSVFASGFILNISP